MPVIAMNVPCKISTKVGTDVYGAPKFSAARASVCAIVKLVSKSQHTTVRADSGATRGHADEATADAVLLISKNIEPEFDSIVQVRGMKLRVFSIRHRMDVMGRLDHYEIRCEIE